MLNGSFQFWSAASWTVRTRASRLHEGQSLLRWFEKHPRLTAPPERPPLASHRKNNEDSVPIGNNLDSPKACTIVVPMSHFDRILGDAAGVLNIEQKIVITLAS